MQRKGTIFKEQVRVQDHFEIDFGVVGPESLAGDTQVWWHKTWGYTTPRGWDNELEYEPGILITLDRAYRLTTPIDKTWWQADLTPHLGATLGNIMTYGTLGVGLRGGFNLSEDVGLGHALGPMSPASVPIKHPDEDRRRPNWGLHVFGGVDARAIGHNIFLDGNTFRDGPSVDKKWFVTDLKGGVAGHVGSVSVSVAYVIRSREFENQRNEQRFTSLALGVAF